MFYLEVNSPYTFLLSLRVPPSQQFISVHSPQTSFLFELCCLIILSEKSTRLFPCSQVPHLNTERKIKQYSEKNCLFSTGLTSSLQLQESTPFPKKLNEFGDHKNSYLCFQFNEKVHTNTDPNILYTHTQMCIRTYIYTTSKIMLIQTNVLCSACILPQGKH